MSLEITLPKSVPHLQEAKNELRHNIKLTSGDMFFNMITKINQFWTDSMWPIWHVYSRTQWYLASCQQHNGGICSQNLNYSNIKDTALMKLPVCQSETDKKHAGLKISWYCHSKRLTIFFSENVSFLCFWTGKISVRLRMFWTWWSFRLAIAQKLSTWLKTCF